MKIYFKSILILSCLVSLSLSAELSAVGARIKRIERLAEAAEKYAGRGDLLRREQAYRLAVMESDKSIAGYSKYIERGVGYSPTGYTKQQLREVARRGPGLLEYIDNGRFYRWDTRATFNNNLAIPNPASLKSAEYIWEEVLKRQVPGNPHLTMLHTPYMHQALISKWLVSASDEINPVGAMQVVIGKARKSESLRIYLHTVEGPAIRNRFTHSYQAEVMGGSFESLGARAYDVHPYLAEGLLQNSALTISTGSLSVVPQWGMPAVVFIPQ